ncbi:MAG: hypothetical protein ETSY1_33870 [Candidatus Entotheonella factor]|uniref:Uncharacterized protein n=1 Tax=Entotheonella factor TaxID=1429438 RepID=W4L993_ENTF1|nr:MAG: hypothetical protein ETSY1_33870 [Candidatus Entotheonella factor]
MGVFISPVVGDQPGLGLCFTAAITYIAVEAMTSWIDSRYHIRDDFVNRISYGPEGSRSAMAGGSIGAGCAML